MGYQPNVKPDLSVFPLGRSHRGGYQPQATEPHSPPPQSIMEEPDWEELIRTLVYKLPPTPNPIAEEMLYADPEWLPPEN